MEEIVIWAGCKSEVVKMVEEERARLQAEFGRDKGDRKQSGVGRRVEGKIRGKGS